MSISKRKYNPNNLLIVTVGTPEITTKKEDGTYNYHLLNKEIRVVGGPFYRLKNNERIRYYFDSITDEIYDDTPEGINILSDGTNHRIILDKCPLLEKYAIATDKIGEQDLNAILHNLTYPQTEKTNYQEEITDLVLLTIISVHSKVSDLIVSDETKQNIINSLISLSRNYCQELTKLTIHHGILPAIDKLNLQKKYLNQIIEIETNFIEKTQPNNINYQLINLTKRLK